jgi:hypothetical protein
MNRKARKEKERKGKKRKEKERKGKRRFYIIYLFE